jgi:hypothetical protein
LAAGDAFEFFEWSQNRSPPAWFGSIAVIAVRGSCELPTALGLIASEESFLAAVRADASAAGNGIRRWNGIG